MFDSRSRSSSGFAGVAGVLAPPASFARAGFGGRVDVARGPLVIGGLGFGGAGAGAEASGAETSLGSFVEGDGAAGGGAGAAGAAVVVCCADDASPRPGDRAMIAADTARAAATTTPKAMLT